MPAGPFKTVPLDFIGGENKSRSRFWSNSSTVNMYVDRQSSGRSPEALMPWPGEKQFSTGSPDVTRGMHQMAGIPYAVIGTTLFSISSFGVKTSLGTIPGSGRCSFADDGTNLVIRNGTDSFNYNGTNVTKISDPDLENAQTVTLLNNQFIYQGTGNRFGVSDPGSPTVINGLNYAATEAVGDDLVQVYAFQEKVYMLGEKSTEVWYNTGTGSPPFERIQGFTSNVGAASPFSAANSEQFMYFLGVDNNVYRFSGSQPQRITPSSIAKDIREAETSDAQGYGVRLEGQFFYILQMPSSDLTLAYSEDTNEWVRLASGNPIGRHLLNGYAFAYGKHLVLDNDSGNVYEWDFETYKSDSDVLIRQRDSSPVNAISAGLPGQRLLMSSVDLVLETGVGNTDEPDPEIMVSASYDGGRSFTNEDWIKIGRESETFRKIRWDNLAEFYDVVIRVKISDPNFISIHGGSIELKTAGY